MMNNIIAAITTGDISGSGKSQTVKEGQGSGASLSAEASGSQSDNFGSMLSLLGAIVSGADNSSTTSSTPAPASSKQEISSKRNASDDSQLMSVMAGLMGVITPQQAIIQKTSFQQTAGGMDCAAETPSDKGAIPVTASSQPLPDTTSSATADTAAAAMLPGADKLGIPVTASSQPLPDTTSSAITTDGNTAGTAPEPSDDSLTHLPTAAHPATSGKTASTGSLQAAMDQNAQGTENPASQSTIQTAAAVPAELTKDTSLQKDNIAAATVSGQSEKSGRSNEPVGTKPDTTGHSQGNMPELNTAVAVNSVAAVNKEADNTHSGHDGQDLSQSDFTAMLKPGEKESEKIQSTDSTSNTSIVHIWGDNSSSKLSATTTVSKETSAVSQTFQNDVVRQIAQKAIPGLQAGQSHIQIDLKPESLGTLRLHVSTDQQQVTVKILADNVQVKEMIERQIPIIKSELQHSGIKVDSVDVGMMSNGSDFASSQHESSAFNQAPSSSGHILHQENTGTDEAPPELRQHQNYIREGSRISYFA
jgi:flagellar hook-length control protein FliK